MKTFTPEHIELLRKLAAMPHPKSPSKPNPTDLVCPRCKRRAFSRWMHIWLNGYKCQNCGYEEGV